MFDATGLSNRLTIRPLSEFLNHPLPPDSTPTTRPAHPPPTSPQVQRRVRVRQELAHSPATSDAPALTLPGGCVPAPYSKFLRQACGASSMHLKQEIITLPKSNLLESYPSAARKSPSLWRCGYIQLHMRQLLQRIVDRPSFQDGYGKEFAVLPLVPDPLRTGVEVDTTFNELSLSVELVRTNRLTTPCSLTGSEPIPTSDPHSL